MYQRVLIPLDGGPRSTVALDVGHRLASIWGAQLDVLGLLEPGINADRSREAIERQTAHLHGKANIFVREARGALGDDIADTADRATGVPLTTLLVMATSARSRSASIMDSVADDVLRRIDAPVLLVGPNAAIDATWPSGSMYVCTDGSTFAEEIFPHAATLASRLDLHPWVLTVVDPDTAAKGDLGSDVAAVVAERLAESMAEVVQREVQFDVFQGRHPGSDLAGYGNRHHAALMALATHGHTGIRRLAMGSVAMHVVHDSLRPVLVARPRDMS